MRVSGPRRHTASRGFTLLELVIAVTLLVSYLLPMMLIISRCKVRAIKYTQQREVRDLAQRQLFNRVHYSEMEGKTYEQMDQGDFAADGRPTWTWKIDPPQMIGSGEQILLEYTIQVTLPQNLGNQSTGSTEGLTEGLTEGFTAGSAEGSTYQMSVWVFPDEGWYEEQDYLFEHGLYSPLYGDPAMAGGSY